MEVHVSPNPASRLCCGLVVCNIHTRTITSSQLCISNAHARDSCITFIRFRFAGLRLSVAFSGIVKSLTIAFFLSLLLTAALGVCVIVKSPSGDAGQHSPCLAAPSSSSPLPFRSISIMLHNQPRPFLNLIKHSVPAAEAIQFIILLLIDVFILLHCSEFSIVGGANILLPIGICV